MKLFAGGAEVPGWRKLLAEERFPCVSLSFVGLTRRIKHLDAWLLADKFPADPGFRQELLLDSGAYSLNRAGAEYSDDQAYELFQSYVAFVTANLDRIDIFSDFDVVQLESADRADIREHLQSISPEKFMPIWHTKDGIPHLEYLAEIYQRVGILQPADEEISDLSPILRRIGSTTKLHGVAMTRMAAMRALPWDSVGSTSWLSPGQYGDTIVWTGNELKRYPVKYREQARKRHRVHIADAGFDAVAIARDATDEGTSEDRKEVLRLSLWSWGRFVEDVNRHDQIEEKVAPPRGAPRATAPPAERRRQLLPILSLLDAEVATENGKLRETQVELSGSNLMQCNTCFARDKCPQFQPDAECAYEIPMTITTSTQARALRKAILAMQAQRVFQMRLFEQLESGYADPNLSMEISRLQKMLNDDAEADREKFSLEIKATSDGQIGFMNRMFGREVEQRVNALEAPVDTNTILANVVYDAEVVER